MAELSENFCIICGKPKNNPKSITCEHPRCINTVLECIGDEGEFMSVARENGIDNPEKLKEYFRNVESLKKEAEYMISMFGIGEFEKLREQLKIVLNLVEDTKKLYEATGDVQNAIEKLE
jgi:hypothetical protein